MNNSAGGSVNTKTLDEQAVEYLARVGLRVALISAPYLTAVQHCKCNTCFCCAVRRLVDLKKGGAV